MLLRLLKRLELPHVSVFKRRWVRRLVIVAVIPQELVRSMVRSTYPVYYGAVYWWRQP